MRHYQLIPVRYNDQQLLVRCEPIDAELWSIQWRNDLMLPTLPPKYEYHWFADCAPNEYDKAVCVVQWLNDLESGRINAPVLSDVI